MTAWPLELRIIQGEDHSGRGSFRARIIPGNGSFLATDHSGRGSFRARIIQDEDHSGRGSFRARQRLTAWPIDYSGLPAAFCFVCQIFYYRPGQRGLYPFRSTNWTFLYYTECIILSVPKRARIKCSGYFWKSSGKRVYPYPVVTLWKRCAILKKMEVLCENTSEGKEYNANRACLNS